MGGNRSVFGVCREAVRVRRLRGQVGFASRCAPIGPLATPRDPHARCATAEARLLLPPCSPRATPPAGVPTSSRRECGACTTRAKPRAVLRPRARRTAMTSAQRGASPMPRRRGGAAAARRARPGGGSGSGGAPPREPPGGAGGCAAARTWRRARRKEEPSSRARATARFAGAKGAPAAEGTPSAPSKWMQPEGRAPATGLASAAGACGQWDAPFPRGVEAPLRAHGFRSATRREPAKRAMDPGKMPQPQRLTDHHHLNLCEQSGQRA